MSHSSGSNLSWNDDQNEKNNLQSYEGNNLWQLTETQSFVHSLIPKVSTKNSQIRLATARVKIRQGL